MNATTKQPGAKSNRFSWVDVAKGICIVAVVGLYTRNELTDAFGSAGWLDPWSAFAKPFRMPDFFLLSGIFLSAVINRPWRSYLDTKVVHYLYFLVLWVSILLAYDVYVRGVDLTHGGQVSTAKAYVYSLMYPEHMLWFIQTLPMFFVATRLLRPVPPLALWGAAAVAMTLHVKTGIHPIDNFLAYYVFFLAGHFAAEKIFAWADWASSHSRVCLALFVVWCFVNQAAVSLGLASSHGGDLLFGFLGIGAVIALSSIVSNQPWLGWLRYAGSNSIVVYLGFFIPLTLFIRAAKQSGWNIDIHVLATFAVLIGSAAPLLLFHATRSSMLRFLFVRPPWAHLTPSRKGSVTAPLAASPKRAADNGDV